MKDLIFEIAARGFYLSFRKDQFTEVFIMSITDGYAGEECHIEPDMDEEKLAKIMKYQFEKLKSRTTR